eukprot:TRINITY_DN2055_c0_g4_i1.p1 TRINITY_DN2055_c0_g4~~TRINITY_DN2055_c0_g4_i1.p1  ORF type:complete len:1115 (-),score=317.45 TRINITY_DN2055_c0_g4_i1:61-3405(-)
MVDRESTSPLRDDEGDERDRKISSKHKSQRQPSPEVDEFGRLRRPKDEDEERDSKDRDNRDFDRGDRDSHREKERDRDNKERHREREALKERDKDNRERSERDREKGRDKDRLLDEEKKDRESYRDRDNKEKERARDRDRDFRDKERERDYRQRSERTDSPPYKRGRKDEFDEDEDLYVYPPVWDSYHGPRGMQPMIPSLSRGGRPDYFVPYVLPLQPLHKGSRDGDRDREREREREREKRDKTDRERESRARGKRPTVDIYEGPMKSYKAFLAFLSEQEGHPVTKDQEKKYEEYRQEYRRKQGRIFFEEHKNEEWFYEKYHPTSLEKKKKEKDERAREAIKDFQEKLSSGFDFSLNAEDFLDKNEPEKDAEMKDGGATSGTEEKPEIKLEPTENSKKEGEDVKGIKEELKSEGEDVVKRESGDEHSHDEQVENKVEAKPAPRIISLKTQSNRLERLNNSNNNNTATPSSDHAPNSNSKSPWDTNTVFIKTVPSSCTKAELTEAFAKVGEDAVVKVSMSEPIKHKGFHRIGWVTFRTPEQCQKALNEFNHTKIKDFELHLAMNRPSSQPPDTPLYNREAITYTATYTPMPSKHSCNLAPGASAFARISPSIAASEERIEKDLTQARKIMELLDSEKGITVQENPLIKSGIVLPINPSSSNKTANEGGEGSSETKTEEVDLDLGEQVISSIVLSPLEQLERIIYYLRSVHSFCYYCGEEFEDEDDVMRKCGPIHLRALPAAHSTHTHSSSTTTSTNATTSHTTENPLSENDSAHNEIKTSPRATDTDTDIYNTSPKSPHSPLGGESPRSPSMPHSPSHEDDHDNDQEHNLSLENNNNSNSTDSTHTTKPPTEVEKTALSWATTLDLKINSRLSHPPSPDVNASRKFIENALEEFLNNNVKKIDEEKFRCTICTKLFRAENFVKKHISLKHEEGLGGLAEIRAKAVEDSFFNNYMTDPKRITPVQIQPPMIHQAQAVRVVSGVSSGGGVLPLPYHIDPQLSMDHSPYRPVLHHTPLSNPLQAPAVLTVLPLNASSRGGPMRTHPQYPNPGGGRGRGGAGLRHTPYPQPSRGRVPLPPPPGVTADPRAMRDYVDLDAPSEDSIQIDYRSALNNYNDS